MTFTSSIKGLAAALALLLVLPLAPWACPPADADANACGSCCASVAAGCCCAPVENAGESQSCGCSLSAVPVDQPQPMAPASARVDLPAHALIAVPFSFAEASVQTDLLPTMLLATLHKHSPPLYLQHCAFLR